MNRVFKESLLPSVDQLTVQTLKDSDVVESLFAKHSKDISPQAILNHYLFEVCSPESDLSLEQRCNLGRGLVSAMVVDKYDLTVDKKLVDQSEALKLKIAQGLERKITADVSQDEGLDKKQRAVEFTSKLVVMMADSAFFVHQVPKRVGIKFETIIMLSISDSFGGDGPKRDKLLDAFLRVNELGQMIVGSKIVLPITVFERIYGVMKDEKLMQVLQEDVEFKAKYVSEYLPILGRVTGNHGDFYGRMDRITDRMKR